MTLVLKKSTTSKGMAKLATDALSVRLFVPGWRLYCELDDLKNRSERTFYKQSLTVAYLDGVAIGVCLTQKWKNRLPVLMTFVRKKHRRNGIGTKLIKKAMSRKNFKYDIGICESIPFFEQFSTAICVE